MYFLNDDDILPTARVITGVGLVALIAAATIAYLTGSIAALGLTLGGFVCVSSGVLLVVVYYAREEKMIVWQDMIDGKCSDCGAPAHLYRREQADAARCVVCGGTIELLENEKETEVDDGGSDADVGRNDSSRSGD